MTQPVVMMSEHEAVTFTAIPVERAAFEADLALLNNHGASCPLIAQDDYDAVHIYHLGSDGLPPVIDPDPETAATIVALGTRHFPEAKRHNYGA
jgi:hypothetical protein